MHLLGIISVLLAYFLYNTNLASSLRESSSHEYDYDDDDDYYYEQEHAGDEPPDPPPEPDLEQRLRAASSVDELMGLVYPSYWAALKCRSKLLQTPPGRRPRPPAGEQEQELTFAAAYFNLDVLKSIESEWRRTQCRPREVCVDVGREFGAPTNVFYKPPCVSVWRCGGCCHSEDKQCRNISTGFLSKTLFEITVPNIHGTKTVTISVSNHTQCSCLSKMDVYKQVHSIIRRALPDCQVTNRTCPHGHSWSSRLCRCVTMATTTQQEPPPDVFSSEVCGPGKELDLDSCQCVCRQQIQTRDCGASRHLDRDTCQCACNVPPPPSCPANQVFSQESCRCTCNKTCPRHQPLDRTTCHCHCSESPNRCFLKGRRFHQATCSCHRPPCEVRRRRCDAGFYFSEEVCRCVPSYWRRLD